MHIRRAIRLVFLFSIISIVSLTALGGIPTSGLVVYYNFDWDSSGYVWDFSGNDHHASSLGAVSYEESLRGHAISLLRARSGVTLPTSVNVRGWTGLTVSMWINMKGQATSGTLLDCSSLGGGVSSTVNLSVGGAPSGDWEGGQFQVTARTTSGLVSKSVGSTTFGSGVTPKPATETWYHVAAVFDGTKILYYVNGAEESEATVSSSAAWLMSNRRASIMIGRALRSASDSHLDGLIDEVRIYNRALSDAELQEIYRDLGPEPEPEPPANPVLYYPFESDTGSNILDHSGEGNDGTAYGALYASEGITNGARAFDGEDDYIDVGTEVGDGIRTISLWFKPDILIDGQIEHRKALICRNSSTESGEFNLQFESREANEPGKLGFGRRVGNSVYSVYSDSATWQPDKWYHVAGTIDPDLGMQLYIDGVLQADTDSSTDPTDTTSDHTAIGSWGDAASQLSDGIYRYFPGCIDEVRLYTNSLSTDQVEGLFYGTLPTDAVFFIVNADPEEHGTPEPLGYGEHWMFSGDSIVNQVENPAEELNGLRYSSLGWNGFGSVPASGSEPQVAFDILEDSVLTWLWQKEYWLDTDAESDGTVDPVDGWYADGANVLVTATPSNDYRFLEWAGDVEDEDSSDNPVTVTMNQPRWLEASFKYVLPTQVGPVLHYRFDNDKGTNIIDSSGNANDGFPVGAVSYTDSFIGRGIRINSHDEYVACETDGIDISEWQGFTFSAMVKLEQYTTYNYVVHRGMPDGSGTTSYGLQLGGPYGGSQWGAKGYFAVRTNALTSTAYVYPPSLETSSAYRLNLNQWYHMVGTYDGINVRFYIDGVLDITKAYGPGTEPCWDDASARLAIGKMLGSRFDSTDSYLHGLIDEVAIYNRGLSQAEVTALYQDLYIPRLTLEIIGNPVEYGEPEDLDYGTNWVATGAAVENSVTSPTAESEGTRKVCTGWTGTGSVPANGTATTVSFAMTEDSTLTWQWVTEYELDTEAGAGGSVNVGDGWYTNGAEVVITATEDDDYEFSGWDGDIPGGNETSNPLTLTMDQARDVTALFEIVSSNLNDGLVAYYPFNSEGTLGDDASGNEHDGTVYGATWTGDGADGGGCYFDGSGDYINLGNETKQTGPFTISIWFTFEDTGTYATLYGGGGLDTGIDRNGIALTHTHESEQLVLDVYDPPTRNAIRMTDEQSGYMDGQWHNVVGIYDGTNIGIFVDGEISTNGWEEIGNVTIDWAWVNHYLGRRAEGDSLNWYWKGKMDEVRIYDRALSEGEIQQLYSMVSDPGLVAHYLLDGNANDKSTNGYHGTVYGAEPAFDRFGVASRAYDFDGADDRIDITSVLLMQELSMNAWFRIPEDADPAQRTIVGADGSYKLSIRTDGTLKSNTKAGTSASGSWTGGPESSNAISQGVWHHVSWSRSSSGYQYLYLDGDLIGEGQYNSGSIPQGYGEFIGMDRMYDGTMRYHWNGCIDDVRIYDRVLSSNEVVALYHAQGTPEVSLEIDGSPAQYGELQDLGYGTHQLAPGTVVSNSVASPTAAVEGTRRACTGWTGTGSVPSSGSLATVSFEITEESTLTWQWITEYELDTEAGDGGSVSVGDGWYESGAPVVIIATTSNDYEFLQWQGDIPAGSETNNPLILTMDQPRDVTAVFAIGTSPDEDLILHYTFEDYDGTNIIDQSGMGNDGLVYGPQQDVNGALGSAYAFDGSNDYIEAADDPSLSFGTGSFTVSAWARVDDEDLTESHVVANKRHESGDWQGWCLLRDKATDNWRIEIGEVGNFANAHSDAPAGTGQFVHLAFVVDRDAQLLNLYVDGDLQTNQPDISAIGSLDSSAPFTVGNPGSDRYYFDGPIDDLRIHNRALTAGEIQAMYEERLESGLVLHYTFNDYDGTNVIDHSGTGNTGAVYGATQVADGVDGSAYQFDGVSDYIDCGLDASLQITGSLTYTVWIKMDGPVDGSNIVIGRRNWDDAYSMASFIDVQREGYGPRMVVASGDWESAHRVYSTNTVVTDGKWHHLAGIYEAGSAIRLYVDGQLVAEEEDDVPASLNWRELPVYIGRESASRYHFKGVMDDVRVYRGVLSSNVVAEMYQALAPDPEDALVLHYTFDQDDGGIVIDQSVSGYTGIVYGASWIDHGVVGPGAMLFDGVDDHISIADFSSSSTGSVSVWVNPAEILDAANTNRCIVMEFKGAILWHESGDNGVRFGTYALEGQGWVYAVSSSPMAADQWYHIVGTWIDGGAVKLYIDGEEIASTSGFMLSGEGPAEIGARTAPIWQKWHGLIDDVRIYDRSLSSNEVYELHEALAPEPGSDLVLHYTFDGDDGTNVWDSSGSENHGYLWGGVTYEDSIAGSAVRINRHDECVRCETPGISVKGLEGMTFSAWVLMKGYTTYNTVVWRGGFTGSAGEDFAYLQQLGGQRSGGIWDKGHVTVGMHGDPQLDLFPDSFNDQAEWPELDRWYHLAWTYDGQELTFYLDGQFDGKETCAYPGRLLSDTNSSTLALGRAIGYRTDWLDTYLDGLIDEVRIYNRSLGPEEIAEIYLLNGTNATVHLAIDGSPDQHGEPAPTGYGEHEFLTGTIISNMVATPVGESDGVRQACAGWTGTGNVPNDGTASTVSFTLTENSTLTWQWITEYELDTEAGEGGSVSVGDGWYENGAPVVITTTTSNGYEFLQWQGDIPAGSETNNPLILTMSQPRDVTALFKAPYEPSAGPVLHYTFDADDGTNVVDHSGYGHHGQMVGTVAYEDSINGVAPRFTSKNTYVMCSDPGLNPSGWQGITYSGWFYLQGHTTYDGMMAYSVPHVGENTFHVQLGGASLGGHLYVATNGVERIYGDIFGGDYEQAPVGEWVHVVGAYNGTSLCTYVNGQLREEHPAEPMDVPVWGHPDSVLIIGQSGGGRIDWSDSYINGQIDEVRIYNRGLSSNEITALYQEIAEGSEEEGPATEGLVAYWPLDSNTLDMTSNHHGTVTGPASYVSGRAGQALAFDGIGSTYVTVPDSPNLDLSTGLTLCAWVKIDNFAQDNQDIISKTGSGAYALTLNESSAPDYEGKFCLTIYAGSDYRRIQSDSHSDASRWHHVAATYDGTVARVFVDGIQEVEESVTGTIRANAWPVILGNEAGQLNEPLGGHLDEVRIYNRGLSSNEISALYEDIAGVGEEEGVKLYYPFAEDTGSNILDHSGNDNDGIAYGAAFTPNGLTNGACTFDGSNDYIDVGGDVGNGLRSISMWFKLDENIDPSLEEITALVVRNTLTENHEFGLYFRAFNDPEPGKIQFFRRVGQTISSVFSDSDRWVAGQWYHLVAAIDPDDGMRMFIDGVLQNDTDASTEPTDTTTEITAIGRWGNQDHRYFNGVIDEFRMHDAALTSNDVAELYEALAPESGGDLLLHYTFDEDGEGFVHDDSGNGWTGVVHGATWSPQGADGGAYSFDGINDHMTLAANQGVVSGTGSFSLAAWVKLKESPSYHGIMQQRDAGSVQGQYMLFVQQGHAGYYEYRDDRGIRIEEGGPFIEDEQWHHVVFTREGDVGRLYVDSSLIGTDTQAPKDISADRNFAIGCDYRDSENYLDGMIDDVRIYNRSLSSNEVASLYDATKPAETENLVLYFPFEEDTGSNVLDHSGNDNDGTAYGAEFTSSGVTNGARTFDGSNDYIDVGTDVGDGIRAISMWFKPDVQIDGDTEYFTALICRNSSTEDGEYNISFMPNRSDEAGKLHFGRRVDHSGYAVYSDSNSWQSGKWYHVAGTIDPDLGMRLYVDGVLQEDADSSTEPTDTRGEHTTLGSWGPPGSHLGDDSYRYFPGCIDEVQLYTNALSSNEVYELYETLAPEPEDDLVVHYTFDDDDGTNVWDSSGNENDGFLVGDVTYADSISGRAIRINTHNEYAGCDSPGINTLGWTGFSVSAWVKLEQYTTYNVPVYRGGLTGEAVWAYGVQLGGPIPSDSGNWEQRGSFYVATNSTSSAIVYPPSLAASGSPRLELETWYHVAGTFDGSNTAFYINGVLDTNKVYGTPGLTCWDDPGSRLSIGKSLGSRIAWDDSYLHGLIDEVKIFNRGISSNEVAELYEALAPEPEDDLVVHYTFDADDGTNVWDSSGNGNHGYLWGGVTYEDSIAGSAVRIDRHDECVRCEAPGINVNGLEGMTFSAWVLMKGYTTYNTVVWRDGFSSEADYGPAYLVQLGGIRSGGIWDKGQASVGMHGDPKLDLFPDSFNDQEEYPTIDRWYHVAWTYDGQELAFYTDGKPDGKVPCAYPGRLLSDTNTSTLALGRAIGYRADWLDTYLNGLIDEVKIYNRALSSSEVTELYEEIAGDGLLLHYTFENDVTTNVVDDSGSGNHGISMAPVLSTDPDFGQVRVFNNDALDHIEVENESAFDFGADDFSIGMWVKPELMPPDQDRTLISKYYYQNQRSWHLQHRTTGELLFGTSASGAVGETAHTITVDNPMVQGRWHHVSVVKSGTLVDFYVDGQLVADNGVAAHSTLFNNAEPVRLGVYRGASGEWSSNTCFSGAMEDVRIYNRGLSSNEIATIYNATKPAVTEELVLYYPFVEDTGSNIVDHSGNNNHGLGYGAAFTTNGVTNGACSFDGSNDYIDVGGEVGNGLRGISLWFKPAETIDDSFADYVALVCRNTPGNAGEFALSFLSSSSDNPGCLSFGRRIDLDGHRVDSNTNEWHAGTWYHVAVTIDPTNGMSMYVDGVSQGDTDSSTAPTETKDDITAIGRWGSLDTRHFNGVIDEVRFYGRPITTNDIIDIFDDIDVPDPEPELGTNEVYLTITGNPDEYGNAGELGYGKHIVEIGTRLTNSVSSPVSGGEGTTHVSLGWTGSGSVPSPGFGTSVEAEVNEESVLTWEWLTLHWLDTEVSGLGTVDVGDSWRTDGSQVTLTATPDPNHIFVRWDGDFPGDDRWNPVLTVTMDQPRTLTAVFELQYKKRGTVLIISEANPPAE